MGLVDIFVQEKRSESLRVCTPGEPWILQIRGKSFNTGIAVGLKTLLTPVVLLHHMLPMMIKR